VTQQPDKHERPAQVSWMLQIQYKPDGPWNDHTGNLFSLPSAGVFMAERQAANPKCRYRLVRVTTTYTVEEQQ
jgi:hypothetical protein